MRFSRFLIKRILFLATILFTAACSKQPIFNQDYTRITVAPGPEDIALDTLKGNQRLIVSCSERRTIDYSKNGFYQYDILSENVSPLTIVGLPPEIQLRPHGIDIAEVDGKTILYCVNHEKNAEEFPPGGRQSILVFELFEEKVIFVKQLTDSLLVSPNDVCADGRGGVFVSIDSGKINSKWEKLMALKRSYVVHYDGKNWKQVGDKLRYANGVGVYDNRLFVTGTQEKTVTRYLFKEDGTLSEKHSIPSMKGNDNITFSGDKLITTAHLDFLKFIKHVKDENEPSPCAIYTIDLKTSEMDTLFLDNGTVMSAASTGLIHKEHLYMAQVFNPFILKVPLKN